MSPFVIYDLFNVQHFFVGFGSERECEAPVSKVISAAHRQPQPQRNLQRSIISLKLFRVRAPNASITIMAQADAKNRCSLRRGRPETRAIVHVRGRIIAEVTFKRDTVIIAVLMIGVQVKIAISPLPPLSTHSIRCPFLTKRPAKHRCPALGLRVFMGGGEHLIFGSSRARLPPENDVYLEAFAAT
ncbi:hypothetical protein EVAR_43030_1 [Eumeta japonica]|uniref:Uncharacterized protein n=1 Tax=Eumeta variegata TaxID=151549 RepID=A0A4C1XN77_EUMVA|nr:hypothetical protein EVAR_43030_1 [Eumeta japonica]